MKNKRMIGVSTEHNITNIIPALQNEINEFILIETSVSKKKNWSEGLLSVLKSHDIKARIIELNESEDNRIEILSEKLIVLLENETNEIIWNLGGEKKTQQLALWQTFLHRNNNQIHDKACYSNHLTHNIEWWFWENDKLKFSSEKISASLSLEEVLSVSGFELKEPKSLVYKKNSPIEPVKNIPDFIDFIQFREYLYKLSGFHTGAIKKSVMHDLNDIEEIFYNLKKDHSFNEKLIELSLNYMKTDFEKMKETSFKKGSFLFKLVPFISKQIFELFSKKIFHEQEKQELFIDNPELKDLLSPFLTNKDKITIEKELLESISEGIISKSSLYFQKILVQRTVDYLNSQPNSILEVYQNIKIREKNTNMDFLEYDILMLTEWGNLIAFDSKTFNFEIKDLDSPLYHLEKMGKKLIDLIPVFPYFESDLDSTWKSHLHKELPFKLSEDRKSFFVVTEKKDNQFIKKSGTKIKYSDEGIKCLDFSNFIEELGLSENIT